LGVGVNGLDNGATVMEIGMARKEMDVGRWNMSLSRSLYKV
jgi:hypothetical protein